MTVRDDGHLIPIERPPVRESVVLVRLALPSETDDAVDESLAELQRLAETAGGDVAATFVQRRETPAPGTHIGRGKAETVRAACEELGATVVIFDSELSPKQGSTLEDLLKCKVVDRTQLILDIFAQRAQTNEGKLQVELAQLEYFLPRLAGRGSIMRQQGGIGVRGPGEQKLEVDRRVIRRRMQRIQSDLENVRRTRRIQRKKRQENSVGTVALVGYTNAGKSSLLNALSESDVYVADKLFATLDPRSRRCKLPSQREIILTDTVGFVRQLPHQLVAAFRATLEEVEEADLLLLVADGAEAGVLDRLQAVRSVLEDLEIADKPVLHVFNKIDVADAHDVRALLDATPNAYAVSAHTGAGLDTLLARIDEVLASRRRRLRLRIPQDEAGLIAQVHAHGRVLHTDYVDNAILIDAEVDPALANRLAGYVA